MRQLENPRGTDLGDKADYFTRYFVTKRNRVN